MRPRNKPPGSSDEVVEQHQQQLEKQLSSSRSGRAVQSVRAGGMDRPSRTKSPGWVTLPPANQAGIPVGSIVYLCLWIFQRNTLRKLAQLDLRFCPWLLLFHLRSTWAYFRSTSLKICPLVSVTIKAKTTTHCSLSSLMASAMRKLAQRCGKSFG